ncbi:MAG: hypothetical protein M3N37_05605, partial [Actinomycetota bacterium]|nr:hypothetical protein [Actinomycetota bacterium]
LEGRRATPESDVYSLGVVLYEALAGRKPFSGDTPLALAHAVLTTSPTPLRELRPDIDASLAATVDRAMDKAPERRFPSAGAMAESLLGSTTGHAGVGAPAGTESATPREATRRVTVGSTQRLPAPPVPEGSVAEEPAEPSWRHRGTRLVTMLTAAAAAVVVGVVALVVVASRDQGPAVDQAPAGTPGTAPQVTVPLPPALEDALRRLEEAVRR